jgi:cytidylate kinase
VIIAIDGPAGSGKSTIAREVAKRLGMRYLDTGAMYRTATLLALEAGLVPNRIDEAAALAAAAPIRFVERPDDLTRVFIGEREVTDDIRGRLVTQNVSAVSADSDVRAVFTERQRAEAARGDVVLEGRDTGTVVFPNADLKIYLVASIDERARRRQLQLEAQGVSQPLEELVADIAARDAYDSGRELAPLRRADDAMEIDTTGMSIAEVIEAVCARAAAARPLATPATTPTSPSGARPPQRPEMSPGSADVRKWTLSRMVRSPLDTLLYRFAYSFIPTLWRLLFRMEISGQEHFPLSGPVVLASNHRSNLDPFFLGVSAPRQIHFMAKAELWKVSILGYLIDRLGAFPINRGEADRQAVRRALEVLVAGAVLGIFPEGHRQRHGGFGEIHPGVTLFSLRQETVTIPVVMDGTERIMRGRMMRFPRVRVAFGPPLLLPEADVARSERALVTSIRLTEAFNELARELGAED